MTLKWHFGIMISLSIHAVCMEIFWKTTCKISLEVPSFGKELLPFFSLLFDLKLFLFWLRNAYKLFKILDMISFRYCKDNLIK